MQLKRLSLTNVRAFTQAEFEFHPGMNLLVGINGAGKSTVLDVLRITLSKILPQITMSKSRAFDFNTNDIAIGSDWLYTTLQFYIEDGQLEEEYEVREWREQSQSSEDNSQRNIQRLNPTLQRLTEFKNENERLVYLKYREQMLKDLEASKQQPFGVYFSPYRSLLSNKRSRVGGQGAAFDNSLADDRGLRLREFADWWLVQKELSDETGHENISSRRLAALNEVVSNFLGGCTNLRAVREPEVTLLIDKDGTSLDIKQLSDGERSMVVLVLDLARRLTQANPELEEPLKGGRAVILIDELDLHLHPSWQRTIVDKLTRTFPNCQFIATTHSPQIIGEVKPPGLTLLVRDAEQKIVVYKGRQGYGLRSGWILKHLMGTPPRPEVSQPWIKRIEEALEEGDLLAARERLEKLRDMLPSVDDEITYLEASINNLEALAREALADEMDSETE